MRSPKERSKSGPGFSNRALFISRHTQTPHRLSRQRTPTQLANTLRRFWQAIMRCQIQWLCCQFSCQGNGNHLQSRAFTAAAVVTVPSAASTPAKFSAKYDWPHGSEFRELAGVGIDLVKLVLLPFSGGILPSHPPDEGFHSRIIWNQPREFGSGPLGSGFGRGFHNGNIMVAAIPIVGAWQCFSGAFPPLPKQNGSPRYRSKLKSPPPKASECSR